MADHFLSTSYLRSVLGSIATTIQRFALGSLCAYFDARSKGAENPKSLLLIRTDAIGDFVLFTPILRHLRRIYGDYTISLVVNDRVWDLASACPYVNEVIPCNVRQYTRNFFYRLRFIRDLRRKQFDVAIYPLFSRQPLGDEILHCSGAAKRIGVDGDLNNLQRSLKAQNDRHYTSLVVLDSEVTLEIEKNRLFLGKLADKEISRRDFCPELWITQADRNYARDLLDAEGLIPGQDFLIVLLPGASLPLKMWPAGNYARLCDRIVEEYGAKILVCGSPEEETIGLEVAAEMRVRPVVLTGKTTLRQLAALLELCDLYLGNDTGPLHIAAAMGIATVCIMGGGHFGRFYPYGDTNRRRVIFKKMDCYHCNWHCIYETARCIQEITVDRAWAVTQSMIQTMGLATNFRHGVRVYAK